MAKRRKIPTPIATTLPPKPNVKISKRRAETARLIRRVHQLRKGIAQQSDAAQKHALQQELETLGGLEAYQRASLLGQSKERGGDSSKWLLPHVRQRYQSASRPDGTALALLDVGALRNNYTEQSSWITPFCIDLNSQSPEIQQQDFMTLEPRPFDVVCLSLVLNFVEMPLARGRMLLHARQFLEQSSAENWTPLLYIVLPLPCVSNSRYMTHEHFVALMKSIGFSAASHHHAKKIAYYLFELDREKSNDARSDAEKQSTKKKINDGKVRNNFCILLPSDCNNNT